MDFLCDYESNNSLFILHPIPVLIYAVLVLFCFLPSVSDFLKTQKRALECFNEKILNSFNKIIIIKVRVQNTPARA